MGFVVVVVVQVLSTFSFGYGYIFIQTSHNKCTMGTCVNRYVRATVMHLHLKIKAREFVGQFANGITNFCLYSNDCTTRENGHGSNGTQDAAIVKVLVACAYTVLSLGFFYYVVRLFVRLCCSKLVLQSSNVTHFVYIRTSNMLEILKCVSICVIVDAFMERTEIFNAKIHSK